MMRISDLFRSGFVIVTLGVVLSLCLLLAGDIYAAETRFRASQRDPFVPLIGQGGVKTISGIREIMAISDVQFEGIVSVANGRRALIINGEIIEEGETIGLVSVTRVGTNVAEILVDMEKHKLKLHEQ